MSRVVASKGAGTALIWAKTISLAFERAVALSELPWKRIPGPAESCLGSRLRRTRWVLLGLLPMRAPGRVVVLLLGSSSLPVRRMYPSSEMARNELTTCRRCDVVEEMV